MKQGCSFVSISIPILQERKSIALSFDANILIIEPGATSFRMMHLLMLCFSARDPKRLFSLLKDWGWDPHEEDLHQEGLHTQFSWKNQDYVRHFWGGQRTLKVSIELVLGSALVGWIRGKAQRHPEILNAIMLQSHCTFQFSIHMDSMFSVASCSYTDIRIGDYSVTQMDRPDWIEALLLHLQGLFCMVEDLDVARLAFKALLSVEEHGNYLDFCTAVQEWGDIRVVQLDGKAFILCDDQPLALCGKEVKRHIQQAAAKYLSKSPLMGVEGEISLREVGSQQFLCLKEGGDPLGLERRDMTLSWATPKRS